MLYFVDLQEKVVQTVRPMVEHVLKSVNDTLVGSVTQLSNDNKAAGFKDEIKLDLPGMGQAGADPV